MTRSVYVTITKPGWYWLTFSALGDPTSNANGPAIDDVRVVAASSLYGAAPSVSVAIPTQSPAAGTTVSYTGFSIIADSLTP